MIIHQNFSLKTYNTFGLDVSTQQYIKVEKEEELRDIYLGYKFRNIKKLILGGGSNLLFTRNWLGLVVHLSIPGIEVVSESDEQVQVAAGAGVIWHQLVMWAVEHGY